ncbi:MAG: diaminopimelate decarboxylase [Acidimicrobiia bacterium]|nr:diaminopimelate decarboxylase [Acidimicrobiia bacterium]
MYDEDDLRARCREYVDAFGVDRVAYAGKAFLCVAMARLIEEEGLSLDIATGGELHVALHAGFPPQRLVFHGNNKSDDELAAALDAGVGRVVVDSFDEIDRLDSLVAGGRTAPAVLVRVTPGVEAHTHEHIETGIEDSKFGLSLERGEALAAARRIAAGGRMRLAGIHCHIGSQVFSLDSYARAARKMAGLVHMVEETTGAPVDEVNVGGGLGVRYVRDDDPPSIAQYAEVVRESLASALAAAGVRSVPRLTVEPGRSVAGPPGLTLYTVGTIKEIPGIRTYVAVDGGMSDNPRPALYGARYEAFVPSRVTAERPLVATIAGKHCEQGDVLVRDAHLPRRSGSR